MLNYTQRFATFGTGSSKKNARTTNATYEQDIPHAYDVTN